MSAGLPKRIRPILRAHPDGMTANEVRAHLESVHTLMSAVHSALRRMPDVYIDRWVKSKGAGGYSPVFVAVEVPDDAPKPDLDR
jgi:hypothetical protein